MNYYYANTKILLCTRFEKFYVFLYAFTTICIPRLYVEKEIKNIEPLYMKR